MKKIKVGSDFSGVGAFNQALMRLGIDFEEVFACDMDKYARQTFIHNYGEPKYFPTDVYKREIPQDPLDIYMTSPPCQAFSLAGKRLGKDDKRGILFFNSHEFIKVNKPRFFIFENVKGLLSDDGGKTFSEWVNMLGGKSVNGTLVMFPHEDSVPYHLYWQVLNAKDHGVPQNRERVFLIGIRDDKDNNFRFPVEERLTKRLKDVLEEEVFEKYYLSEKMVEYVSSSGTKDFYYKPEFLDNESEYAKPITTKPIHRAGTTNYYIEKSNLDKYYLSEKMQNYLESHKQLHKEKGNGFGYVDGTKLDVSMAITTKFGTRGTDMFLKIKSATSHGYEEATDGDSISLCHPNSDTRRERIGSGDDQTIDTTNNQKVIYNIKRLNQTLAKHQLPKGEVRFVDSYNQSIHEESVCINARINATNDRHLWDGYKIRRLTPRECFRLMDFPDTFTWPVSDSQAYKQAGNSIVVNVLYKILQRLPI